MPLHTEFYRKGSDKPEVLPWGYIGFAPFWEQIKAEGEKPFSIFEHVFKEDFTITDTDGKTVLLDVKAGDYYRHWR